MGACLGRLKRGGDKDDIDFPLGYSDLQICDHFVDRLPSRLQGHGLHLLGAGPGPLVQRWTHELLDSAGVHSYQDRELLLKQRDRMVAAVERHRQRRRLASCPSANRISLSGAFGSGRRRSADVAGLDTLSGGSHSSSNGVAAAAAGSADGHEHEHGHEHGHGAAAAHEDPEEARRAAAAAAAAAAAKAAATVAESDGKPFKLTSDWLTARGGDLYRISEERHVYLRHEASDTLEKLSGAVAGAGGGGSIGAVGGGAASGAGTHHEQVVLEDAAAERAAAAEAAADAVAAAAATATATPPASPGGGTSAGPGPGLLATRSGSRGHSAGAQSRMGRMAGAALAAVGTGSTPDRSGEAEPGFQEPEEEAKEMDAESEPEKEEEEEGDPLPPLPPSAAAAALPPAEVLLRASVLGPSECGSGSGSSCSGGADSVACGGTPAPAPVVAPLTDIAAAAAAAASAAAAAATSALAGSAAAAAPSSASEAEARAARGPLESAASTGGINGVARLSGGAGTLPCLASSSAVST